MNKYKGLLTKANEAIKSGEIKPFQQPTLADFDRFEKNYRKALKEHNKTVTKRKLIPKSIEVTIDRKPFSTKVTATLSIKLELTQELTPKQIEYILTTHLKRI